jgi:hypothetical protein
MTDPLSVPILRALLSAGEYAPTTREVTDATDPPDSWAGGTVIVISPPLVQESLRRLVREGLAEQVVGAAQYHHWDEPTPVGERRWRITPAGQELLASPLGESPQKSRGEKT